MAEVGGALVDCQQADLPRTEVRQNLADDVLVVLGEWTPMRGRGDPCGVRVTQIDDRTVAVLGDPLQRALQYFLASTEDVADQPLGGR